MKTRTGLAALATSGLLLAGLTGCGDDAEPTSSEAGGQTASDSAGPTDPADPGDSPTESATEAPDGEPDPSDAAGEPGGEGGTAVVPVYFVGDTPFGPRLYREFHEVDGVSALAEAASLLTSGAADDPDYGTLLSGVKVQTVEASDGEIVVTLREDSPLTAGKGTSSAEARLAVQSLVYTLQGVAQDRAPVVVRLADGSPADLYGQPTGKGVTAAKPLDVLALVSLTTPTEGQAVSGTLKVEGVASSFEATVPWQVLDGSGKAVLDGFATAEQFGDRLYPFSTSVDVSSLDPGTYTFVARTDDPSDGEGPGPYEDTRTFRVG